MNVKSVLLLICLLFLFIKVSCKRDAPQITDPNLAKQKLAEFSKLMHISFPPSTRLTNFKHIRGMDDVIFLKVEIAQEDLQSFIQNSPFANIPLRSREDNPIPIVGSTGPSWWNVKSVRKWKTGRARLPGAKALQTLIDLDHSNKVIVYLKWFES